MLPRRKLVNILENYIFFFFYIIELIELKYRLK